MSVMQRDSLFSTRLDMSPCPTMPPLARAIHLRLLIAAAYFWHMIHLATILYASPLYWKRPYHTSALSDQAWVKELIVGHPNSLKTELGLRLHVFFALIAELHACGLTDSKHIILEEQAAIFLYACVTGTYSLYQ
jgi:hypothetical protein